MKRTIITSVAVLCAWCAFGVNFASAQFGNLGQAPTRRPAVSPYINLGIGGGGAMSYYGLIRPQVDANRSIMDLQNVVQRMNPDGSLMGQLDQQNQGPAQTGLQTGHAATYFNYGHYYPMTGTAGSGTGNTGGLGGTGMGGFNSNFGAGGNAGGGPRTFYGNTFGNNMFPR